VSEHRTLGLRAQKKLDTWRTIRQATLTLIAERGFENVSIEEIASTVRVSKSTLFNYFASKEAILFDPDPQEQEHWQQLLDARPVNEALWDTLQAFFLAYTGGYPEKLTLQKQLLKANPSMAQARGDSGEQVSRFLVTWSEPRLTAQGQDPQQAAFFVQMALTIVGTAFQQWPVEEGFPALHATIRQRFQLVGRGLLNPA